MAELFVYGFTSRRPSLAETGDDGDAGRAGEAAGREPALVHLERILFKIETIEMEGD